MKLNKNYSCFKKFEIHKQTKAEDAFRLKYNKDIKAFAEFT